MSRKNTFKKLVLLALVVLIILSLTSIVISQLNPTATTDKTVYLLGETVTITLTNAQNSELEIRSEQTNFKFFGTPESTIEFTPETAGNYGVILNEVTVAEFRVEEQAEIQLTKVVKEPDPTITFTSSKQEPPITLTTTAIDDTWWNDNYNHRAEINITNTDPSNPIKLGHTINVSIDAETLANNSKLLTSCDDLRVAWYNSTWQELDRVISYCNTTNTEVEFMIQENISANVSNVNYYLYYGYNGATSPPENKSKVYYLWEDFEDQSHEFTDGPLNPTINAISNKSSNYGLEGDGLAGYARAVKPDTIPEGLLIEGWVYSGYAGDNADLPGLEFGMQSSGDQRNGYQVILDWRSGSGGTSDMQIRENYNSGSPLDTSTENTVVADTWYYIMAYWKENGDINATIYDENMNYYGSLNANDATYTKGYYGVGAYRDGFWDDVKLTFYKTSAPISTLGGEKVNNPLSVGLIPENNSVIDSTEVNLTCNASTQYELNNVTLYINASGT